MDRIIEVRVNGDHISKDSRYAGVQHEANAKRLRISFDAGWDGYAKKVTFWDALGGNPTTRTLTADLLEDITKDTRVYLCPIPGEVMGEAGEIEFAIDGWLSGVRQRTVGDRLSVKSSPYDESAAESADPTPSQAEQLQQQIDSMLDDISEQAAIAYESAERAAIDAAIAAEAGHKGEMAAQYAKEAAASAASAASDAQRAESAAEKAAEEAVAEVSATLAENAQRSEENAAASDEAMRRAEAAAQSAAQSEAVSTAVADSVRDDTNAALGSAQAAEEAAQRAEAAKQGIIEAERIAGAYAEAAAGHSIDAQYAKEAAEQAAREAQQAAGGDFATPAYVDEKAQEAESNAKTYAKNYTDQKFANIPDPDVSAEIEAHNTDKFSHQDIRAKINSKAELFMCAIGQTTNAQIEEAVDANMIVMVKYGNYMLQYTERVSSTHHIFRGISDGVMRTLSCEDGSWRYSESSFTAALEEELSKSKKAASVTLNAAVWVDKLQMVNFGGVNENSIIIVSPDPAEANFKAYADCGVRCQSQGNGTLTFACEDVPSVSLIVNVAMFN